MQNIKGSAFDHKALGRASEKRAQRGKRFVLEPPQFGDLQLCNGKRGSLRRHLGGVGQACLVARGYDVHEPLCRSYVRLGNVEPFAQRQQLKVLVGDCSQGGQRERVPVCLRGDEGVFGRVRHRMILPPEVHLVAGRQ